jgi:MFS transporter, ACS family, hexuronate transporter
MVFTIARWARCTCVDSGRESLVASTSAAVETDALIVTGAGESERVSSYRWTICALLFVATTINYIDRQVLGILAPTLQRALNWTESDYGDIVSWFSFAYAFGFLAAGRLIDWIGVRRGLAAAVVAWSAAAIGHAFARTVAGFSLARALLGVSESAIFPGSIKAVAEWFPQRERALATGIFNAGTNTGAILTPLLVPWIALKWGWQWAFVATGGLGLLWLLIWIPFYRDVGARANESTATPRVRWTSLFAHRQTWAFIVGKLLADPVWWFYLYWLPKFLDAKYGVKLAQVAAPIIVVYLVADVGSVGGGWISSALIKRGWSVNRARKTTMLAMALLIVPTTLVSRAPSMWAAVVIVGIAAAAHQAWSANVYTLASDMFPKFAVGSVVGIGAFGGAMGGVVFQRITGRVLQANGSDYTPIFVVCGLAYVTAWLIIHLLAPRLEPARLETQPI